ncbi:MAG: cell division protein FtsW [Selenomonadaceae bacterium]|nr:cell division protein FtsW [Selenomonadaceae bacterium]MBR4695150.1 cell division protein FtsW [Selenomonadaceae bacterium]
MEALLAIMVVLVILGTINVFSSSFILSEADYNTPYFFLRKQLVNVGVGLLAFFLCWRVDYHRWRDWMPIVLALTMLSLVLVLVIGPSVNGARRWLPLPFFQIQPAEIAKLVSIMMAAAYLSSRVQKGKEVMLINAQAALIGIMFILTEKEPDMGTACIILGVPLLMTALSGLRMSKLIRLVAAALAGVVVMCMMQPYRMERIKVTWDPWSDAQNVGYQTVQSLSAIGSGEFWGMGLGVGVSKYDYLPEAHTDFAFAIFCQENGFVGAIFVFLLFAALTVYAARVANKAVDAYGQILAMGILLLIVGQAVANLLMVGGAFPVVGVPLPFISYGGTSLIVTMASMGILINIGRQGDKAYILREQEEFERRMERTSDPYGLRLLKKERKNKPEK